MDFYLGRQGIFYLGSAEKVPSALATSSQSEDVLLYFKRKARKYLPAFRQG